MKTQRVYNDSYSWCINFLLVLVIILFGLFGGLTCNNVKQGKRIEALEDMHRATSDTVVTPRIFSAFTDSIVWTLPQSVTSITQEENDVKTIYAKYNGSWKKKVDAEWESVK
jgi:hypothetical protein